MKLTSSQHRAVTHRGSNLLVSASAGSGKTEMLGRRVVSLLTDATRPVSIDRLLVVTFTRAAAAELRERIGKMLRAAYASADPAMRAQLRRNEQLLDTADIGTIDSWCQRLVRQHFASLGIDPAFRMLSPQEASLLRKRTLDELFDWAARSDDATASASGEWLARGLSLDRPQLRTLVQDLHAVREHLVDADAWLAERLRGLEAAPDPRRAAACEVLTRAMTRELDFQIAQYAASRGGMSESLAGVLDGYAAMLAEFRGSLSNASRVREVATAIDECPFPTKRGKKLTESDGDTHDSFKKRWFERRLRGRFGSVEVARVLDHLPATDSLLRTALALESRFNDMLTAAHERLRAYTFGDVQRLALQLLATRGDDGMLHSSTLARDIAARYDDVLVDEVQDTSPLQTALLRLITRQPPDAGNRTMVGDIKQSIYGFRQAEPRLFAEQRDAIADGREAGHVELLSDNFRSHPRLLAGFNSIFANLFEADLGGTAFGERERLAAGRVEPAGDPLGDAPRIELHALLSADDEPTQSDADDGSEGGAVDDAAALERIEIEAAHIAEQIARLRAGGPIVIERSGDTLTRRDVRYGDIVILLRSAAGNAPLLAHALRSAGVPCAAKGRELLLDSREVSDLRSILALLVNRRQDIPLAAWLRSPSIGLTTGELLRVRQVHPRGALWDALDHVTRDPQDSPLRQTCRRAAEQLDAWMRQSRVVDLPELVRILLRDTATGLLAEALPQGDHRAAMLDAFVSLATDFASKGGDLTEFVAFLDQLSDENQTPEIGVPTPADVVQIMTIHASKGLEFPIVFLAGAGASMRRRERFADLLGDERIGLGVRFDDLQSRNALESPEFGVLKDDARRRQREEELRLLYVAATRAREKLLVVGHVERKRWSELCDRGRRLRRKPPLIERLDADSALEWVTMAALAEPPSSGAPQSEGLELCAGGTIGLRQFETSAVATTQTPQRAEASPVELPSWVDAGLRAIADRPQFVGAGMPAVLSISTVKQAAMDASDAPDVAATLVPRAALRHPRFAKAGGSERDGRALGDAVHRLMQHADLARLATEADVRTQIAQLVADGRLDEADAALIPVEDVAWFGRGTVCRDLLESSSVEREVPFVYSMPAGEQRVLLRGVIDVLAHNDDGLALVDYKTDLPGDQLEWDRRLAGYEMQLRCYGLAAAEIFKQPVKAMTLVLIREQRVHRVPTALPTADEILRLAT